MLMKRSKRLEKLFGDMFDIEWTDSFRYPTTHNKYANIYSLDNKLFVEMEMAGYGKGDINVSFDKGVLNISASKQITDDKDIVWYNKSFIGGLTEKSISVPVEIQEDKIVAELENGILTISMDLKEKETPKKIKIS